MEIRVQNTAKMTLNITDPRQLLNQFMAVILSLYIALFCVLNPPNLPVFSTKYDGVNVNALTDVNLSAKGDLLLQGGEYNVGGNVGLDIGGKVYLQGTVDTQYSFSHVNDNNGFTITDTTKVNQTQVAHMPSMVVGGTNGIEISNKVVLGGKNEDGSVGLTHDGAWVGAGTLAGLFPKEGGDKGSGGGKDPYAGDTTTQVASINPEGVGYEYLKAINDNTNTVDGKAVNLTTINYKEQTVQLGTLGQLAVMIATNAIAPGLANSLSGVLGLGAGTASQAALSAMVKAAVSQGFTGMITGEIDIANAAAAIGSAGLGSFLTTGFGNLITEGMSPAQLAAYQASPIGAQNGLLSTQYITNGMSGAFINAGVTSMTYGTDFMDNMTTNIQNFGINALTDLGYYGAGEFKQYASLGDGTFSASIVHGVIGCASAKAQGATCAQGFTTSFATEAFSGMFDKGYVADPTKSAAEQESARKAYEQNNAMLFGSIVGTIVSGGDMNLMNIGGGLSTSATANNRQLHIKEAELIRKYAGEYAKERRITLAQAEKELTEQALRQVDENWAKQTTQNDKASTFLAGLASGTIAGTEGDGSRYADVNQNYFQAEGEQFTNGLINVQMVSNNSDLYKHSSAVTSLPGGIDQWTVNTISNQGAMNSTNFNNLTTSQMVDVGITNSKALANWQADIQNDPTLNGVVSNGAGSALNIPIMSIISNQMHVGNRYGDVANLSAAQLKYLSNAEQSLLVLGVTIGSANKGKPVATTAEQQAVRNGQDIEFAPVGGKLLWGSWNDYPKVTVNTPNGPQQYAKIGDRLYSEHAVARMQPSGQRYSSGAQSDPAANPTSGTWANVEPGVNVWDGNQYVRGRSISPNYVEDIIQNTKPILQGNQNWNYTSGDIQVILSPDKTTIITIIN